MTYCHGQAGSLSRSMACGQTRPSFHSLCQAQAIREAVSFKRSSILVIKKPTMSQNPSKDQQRSKPSSLRLDTYTSEQEAWYMFCRPRLSKGGRGHFHTLRRCREIFSLTHIHGLLRKPNQHRSNASFLFAWGGTLLCIPTEHQKSQPPAKLGSNPDSVASVSPCSRSWVEQSA